MEKEHINNIQNKLKIEVFKDLIGDCLDKTILDVGSGESPIAYNIQCKKVITLDSREEVKPNIVCDLDSQNIPLEENSIDIMIVGEILEHTLNPYKIVRRLYKPLKKGGIVVVSVPNIPSLINRIRFLIGRLPNYSCKPHDNNDARHIIDFNKKYLIDVLTKAEFKIEKIKSNGIINNSKLLWFTCPATWGETLIIKAIK